MSDDVINLSENDFVEDKYSRFKLISWWEQERIRDASVMVVGAGALGNELIKNLSLLGIGKIIIVDMDLIENTNLTRSVLFRKEDVGLYKADVASARAKEINPDIKVCSLNCNVIDDIGLGVFRYVDYVLGGLDNREARLAINQAVYKVNKAWIDGAIEVLNGFARVFVPGQGACYECTMTEMDWKLINKRKSCALLSNQQMAEGKIPTTPTSSSIIAGVQVQELLKLLHSERNLPVLAGKCFVFNGLTHDSYVVEYQEKPDCMSHDKYKEIVEINFSVRDTTIRKMLSLVKKDLGETTVLIFDREIALQARCSCGEQKDLFLPVHKIKNQDILCSCGKAMLLRTTHTITGDEEFLDKTLYEIGIPLFHIITARNKNEEKHYEFSKDKNDVLKGII